jgi:ketopantoate reductase
MFAGAVMAMGETYGIPVPVNETLFFLIKTLEEALTN